MSNLCVGSSMNSRLRGHNCNSGPVVEIQDRIYSDTVTVIERDQSPQALSQPSEAYLQLYVPLSQVGL